MSESDLMCIIEALYCELLEAQERERVARGSLVLAGWLYGSP